MIFKWYHDEQVSLPWVPYGCVITVASQWVRWHLKSPASGLFAKPFVQARITENIKAPRHWPLWGESPVTGGFPLQRACNAESVSKSRSHHGKQHVLQQRASTTENVSIWWRHCVIPLGSFLPYMTIFRDNDRFWWNTTYTFIRARIGQILAAQFWFVMAC